MRTITCGFQTSIPVPCARFRTPRVSLRRSSTYPARPATWPGMRRFPESSYRPGRPCCSTPYGLAFDLAGNLYIADNYNQTVEAVNLGTTTATITGVAIPPGAIYSIVGAYGCPFGTTGCKQLRLLRHGKRHRNSRHVKARQPLPGGSRSCGQRLHRRTNFPTTSEF